MSKTAIKFKTTAARASLQNLPADQIVFIRVVLDNYGHDMNGNPISHYSAAVFTAPHGADVLHWSDDAKDHGEVLTSGGRRKQIGYGNRGDQSVTYELEKLGYDLAFDCANIDRPGDHSVIVYRLNMGEKP